MKAWSLFVVLGTRRPEITRNMPLRDLFLVLSRAPSCGEQLAERCSSMRFATLTARRGNILGCITQEPSRVRHCKLRHWYAHLSPSNANARSVSSALAKALEGKVPSVCRICCRRLRRGGEEHGRNRPLGFDARRRSAHLHGATPCQSLPSHSTPRPPGAERASDNNT